jgi:hypothetical protein
MKVLGHHYIIGDNEVVLSPHLLQDLQKEITAAHRIEKLLATITAASDEVPVTGMVESPQTFGHDRSL